jgi:sortase (surface protein transpeptidase)
VNWRLAAAGVALVAAVTGLGWVVTDRPSSPDTVSTEPVPVAVAEPSSIAIPRINVRSSLIGLGRDKEGSAPAVPDARTQWAQAAWFNESPAPGDYGGAVIVGHVDGGGHRGVFHDLDDLTADDEVLIGRADGTWATFRVTTVEQIPKDQYPAERIHGVSGQRELWLISCGGSFDRGTGQYRDSVIVHALLR